jgi:hypothetical protein
MQYYHLDEPNPCHPAGDSRKPHLRVDFDRRLKLEFHSSKITSDAGLLAYRELDEVLGLTDLAGAALSDLRRGKNTRLRQITVMVVGCRCKGLKLPI